MRIATKEEMQKKIDNLELEFYIVEYLGYGKKSKFRHSCGYEFEIRIDHLLNRKKCPKCNNRKYELEDFQLKSDEIHNKSYKIIEFNGVNKKIKALHYVCKNIIEPKGLNHLRGDGCSYCYGNKKYTKEEITEISNNKWKGEFTILSDELDYNKKALIIHNKCGNMFEQKISSHLLRGGCSCCAGNRKHDIESIQNKSNKIHNNEYKIIEIFNNKTKILHKSCGNEFIQVIKTHLSGCGCPKCRTSKGEILIDNFLKMNNIQYITQKTFNECKFVNKLKFDFYLPEFNICIEFDGEQHYRPIRHFGGKKAFELQKIKDNIKNDYCKSNNIRLIRIKYNDNIQKYLEDIFFSLSLPQIKI